MCTHWEGIEGDVLALLRGEHLVPGNQVADARPHIDVKEHAADADEPGPAGLRRSHAGELYFKIGLVR